MTATPAPASTAPAPGGLGQNLRVRGLVILILVLIEILLGNQLAVAGSPYPLAYLAGHIALALIVSGFAAHAFLIARRWPGTAIRVASGLTFLAAVAATLGGTWFLVGGMTNPALYTMEGSGGLAFLGSILIIVFGGRPSAPPVATPA